jgi:hypothetical protein
MTQPPQPPPGQPPSGQQPGLQPPPKQQPQPFGQPPLQPVPPVKRTTGNKTVLVGIIAGVLGLGIGGLVGP